MASVTQQQSSDREGHATEPNLLSNSPSKPPTNGTTTSNVGPDHRKLEEEKSQEDGARRTKKRRKVNHACLYCQRSHMTCDEARPCARCVKRSIGHLCHDEPHEWHKKSKSDPESSSPQRSSLLPQATGDSSLTTSDAQVAQTVHPTETAEGVSSGQPLTASASASGVDTQSQDIFSGQPYLEPKHWQDGNQSQIPDMRTLHPNYMFNSSEVSNEYNLLSDFLSTSLIDDAYLQGEDPQAITDISISNTMDPFLNQNGFFTPAAFQNNSNASLQAPTSNGARFTSGNAIDKAREKYYMTAADPAGTDTPEIRMNKLLKAKYDAGLLKPFNYVNGYARLEQWMKQNIHQKSREDIQRRFNSFRPKFRERTQKLTDLDLVMAEMWFEQQLMEYDRIFASMAIPACCWRRTGEITRGNREMSELINVPLEQLREGKLSLHQILHEDSLVKYWERFTNIAFAQNEKAILTSCILKTSSNPVPIRCCFSFTVSRDPYQVPALIVGNFLPTAKEE